VKGALLSVLATAAIVAGLGALFAWSPWESRERERELAWLRTYVTWYEGLERELGWRVPVARAVCEERFDLGVGDAPTSRYERIAAEGRRSCRALDSDDPLAAWRDAYRRVTSRVLNLHFARADATYEADLSRIAASIAGTSARVLCWQDEQWAALAEQRAVVDDDLWAIGLAHTERGRIDLAPEVCDPLRRFFRSRYSPLLNLESYALAEALVTLAHEAEHLRVPDAAENVVECYALQRVRGLVRDEGRGARYQAELAGLAWEVGYPRALPWYRTKRCFDGGPLDLDPRSSAWP